MDKTMLYNNGVCKICGHEPGSHYAECPGAVIDSLVMVLKYGAEGCGRGCCGGYSSSATGPIGSLDSLILTAANSLEEDYGPEYAKASWRYMDSKSHYVADELRTAMTKIRSDRKAKEEAEEEARRKEEEKESRLYNFNQEMAELEARKDDFKPGVYERYCQQLRETYKDVE